MDISDAISRLDWNREPKGLYAPIGYTLTSGGKRLRPTLVMIASELFGGKEEDVLSAALAIELFHNFTLLHDDVMDKADMRRGRPTVHVKWDDNTAILSGDQMLIEAYKLLSQVRGEKLPRVLQLFNKMATEICEGQQYDVDFERRDDVSLDDYMMMIRLKTSVLLGTALQIGAYISDATEEEQAALYEFGIHIGLAFQIQDDLLDVYGDPETFGKAIGGDISNNKKTYVLLSALAKADATTSAEIARWMATTEKSETKIHAVTAIYNRLGVRKLCENAIADHTRIAMEQLRHLPNNDANRKLRQLAEQLIIRKS